MAMKDIRCPVMKAVVSSKESKGELEGDTDKEMCQCGAVLVSPSPLSTHPGELHSLPFSSSDVTTAALSPPWQSLSQPAELDDSFLKEQEAILKQIEEMNLKRKGKKDGIEKDWTCDVTPRSSLTSTVSREEQEALCMFSSSVEESTLPRRGIESEPRGILAQILDASKLNATQRQMLKEVTDDQVVEAQQRLMEACKSSMKGRRPPLVPTPQAGTETRPCDQGESSKSHPFPSEIIVEDPKNVRATNPQSSTKSCYRDRVLRLANGRALFVKGTKHVYKSIATGNAVLVQCSSCGIVSQVEPTSQALYCTICHQVTPVDLGETRSTGADMARSL